MPANRQNNSNFFNYSALIDSTSQRTTAAQNDGVRTAVTAATAVDTTASPATAASAPSKGTNSTFVGLCEALNQYQKDLVKKGTYEIADEYVIKFAPATIGSSKVTKPGPVTYKNTAGKNVTTAQDKLDKNTDQVNTNSETWQVLAGTQVVQLIDQVMRGSTYITSQQKVSIDADGKQTKNATAGTGGVTAWYKINLTSQQLGYDKKRRDYAYRMIFTISPYAINQMASPYFPDSTYRGAHKAYNYWFTGQNTQILSYEQEYNQAYYTTLSGNPNGLATTPPTGRDQFKQTHMATSEQQGQGQANYVNEPANSAASFLYSVADFGQVRMKIIGDPGWMQQGEAAFGVDANTFNFGPFDTDGTINYDSQQVTYTVSFSRPTDYNFNTGVMNISASDAPQETFTFMAISCKNVFSKGQFTQELVGSLLPGTNSVNAASAANGRIGGGAAGSIVGGALSAIGSRISSLFSTSNSNPTTSSTDTTAPSSLTGTTEPFGYQNEDQQNADGNGGNPQPAAAPEAPTSSGDIDYNAGLAGTSPGTGGFTPPATAAAAVANANGGAEALTPEAKQIQALGASLNKPQVIAKDDS